MKRKVSETAKETPPHKRTRVNPLGSENKEHEIASKALARIERALEDKNENAFDLAFAEWIALVPLETARAKVLSFVHRAFVPPRALLASTEDVKEATESLNIASLPQDVQKNVFLS